MKTDKQLFAIFSAKPEWIFELTDLESPGECDLQAIVLKALEQQADAVVVPRNPAEKLTVVEFQFQDDPQIYTRVAIEMALVQQQQDMREVQGIIFFRYPGLDPLTEPWRQIIRSYTLREMLESLAQRSPEHPLVAVFQPVLLSNEQTLEAHAVEYYRQIRTSDLSEDIKQTLLDVFVNWLEQRFKGKSQEGIQNMLLGELPDLRDTQSGKDLIRIGKIEGARETLVRQLEAKFGKLSAKVRQRIKKTASADRLDSLLLQVLTIESPDQLQW